jgi:K+-sensing histidine kinase KdpD
VERAISKRLTFVGMQHRLSIILMSLSLLLLAGFLGLFLKKSWSDELDALKKETGFLFVNSIRGIEGEALDKLVFRHLQIIGDTASKVALKLPGPLSEDSLKVMTFIGEKTLRQATPDTNFKVTIHATNEQAEEGKMSGSLSMIVALSEGKGKDSLLVRTNNPAVLPMLTSNFTKAMKSSGLPVKFRIISVMKDSIHKKNTFRSGSYSDLASGDTYEVEFSNFKGYIFKKIAPEILFSFTLFSCVALAFFSVHHSLRQQHRLTELKNDFIRNMTHELKTPIASVSVAVEAMQNFDALENPQRTREYLEISKSELNRLSLLVDKVLRMSLFEKAEPELNIETFDLKLLLEEVLQSMKLQFEKQKATIIYLPDKQPFMVEGDRLHLASVLYNLLDNAIKYSKNAPEIELNLVADPAFPSSIFLKIKDNGIGIPVEYQERIFERFFRVPTGDVHNVKGHGLGLNYVASVIRKHQGEITLESQPGQGSAFLIRLPNAEKIAA